ncbi:MAG: hypothetical protein EA393_08285 [Bacteroidetes bacterium]|nr:MAG: hypothetical protein EA393_08285 [Bacteroidota bacterium]
MKLLTWRNIRKTPEVRQKTIIFVVCLVFSFIFWLSIKLSRESEAIIPIEFQVTNIPIDLIFTGQSDSTFVFTVQSTGIRLITSGFLRRIKKLETDFRNLQQLKRDGERLFFFTSSQAETRFSLLSDIPRSAVEALPDTIFFQVEDAFFKRVPVKLIKDLNLQPGFKLYDVPAITPDSLDVYGPAELADTIRFFNTSMLTATQVEHNINCNLKIDNPWRNQQVNISADEVEVFISVEEFTEATVEIPLNVDCDGLNNISANGELMLFPDKVTVFYLVALKDDKKIIADMFRAYVSCPDTIATSGQRLAVEIREKPTLIDLIRVSPPEVEYIWIKR